MSRSLHRFLAWLAIVGAVLAAEDRRAVPEPGAEPSRFRLGEYFLDISAIEGRLVFQQEDGSGMLVGEPWYWPEEEGSPASCEEPRLVENTDGTWLVFRERSEDGERSRAVSLSETFAGGFAAATVAAFSRIVPAVGLSLEAAHGSATTRNPRPPIRVHYATPTGIRIDAETLAFRQAGQPLAMDCSQFEGGAECLPREPLEDGFVTIEAKIADVAGYVAPWTAIEIEVDSRPPTLHLAAPRAGFTTTEGTVQVSGFASEPLTLEVGDQQVEVAEDLRFSVNVPLTEGANVLILTATDRAGNQSVEVRSGFSDSLPPPPVAAERIATSWDHGTVQVRGAPGATESRASVFWRNPRTGDQVEALAAVDGSFRISLAGEEGDTLMATAVDAWNRPGPEAAFEIGELAPAVGPSADLLVDEQLLPDLLPDQHPWWRAPVAFCGTGNSGGASV